METPDVSKSDTKRERAAEVIPDCMLGVDPKSVQRRSSSQFE